MTITSEPYTVPAPLGFTPIASNPINAGADLFTAVDLSTTTTQNEQPVESGTDDTTDTAPDVSSGRRLLDTGLHIRAEKSFSNVNRVICDETTRYYTTSFKPFTVRHSTMTSTVTWFNYGSVATITESTVSTKTEVPVLYEETTETVATTNIATSLVYETKTVTPTYELSDLPRSTVHAACVADNMIGGIAGYGIVNISPRPIDRNDISAPPQQARSPQSCCEACISQSEGTCAGSVWFRNTCFFIIKPSQCDGSDAVISFDLSRGRQYAAFEGMLLSNGACGQQVWSGNYCDFFGENCAVDPRAAKI